VKLFVTASVTVRAKRRFAELQGRGESPDFADVLADMQARDDRDTKRAVAPLVPAADAVIIDNSDMTPQQVLDAALDVVRTKLFT
jgi:cytidylate kinase